METSETPSQDPDPTERSTCSLQDGDHTNDTLLQSAESHCTDSHKPSTGQLQDRHVTFSQTFSTNVVNHAPWLTAAVGQQHTTFNQFPNDQGSVLSAVGPHFQMKSFLNPGRVGFQQAYVQPPIGFQQAYVQPQHCPTQSLSQLVNSNVQSQSGHESQSFEQFQIKPATGSSSEQHGSLCEPEIKTEVFVNASELAKPQGLTVSQLQTPNNNDQKLMTLQNLNDNEQKPVLQNLDNNMQNVMTLQIKNTCDQNLQETNNVQNVAMSHTPNHIGQQNQLPENLVAASSEPTTFALLKTDRQSPIPCSLPLQHSGNVFKVDQIPPHHHDQSSVSLPGQRSSLPCSVEQQTPELSGSSQVIDTQDVSPCDTHTTDPKTQTCRDMDTHDIVPQDTHTTDPKTQSSQVLNVQDVSQHYTHTTDPKTQSAHAQVMESMTIQGVSPRDLHTTDDNTQPPSPPVIIDEEDILILWSLLAECKQFKTNGETARYLLSLYFNPGQDDIQSTDSCCVYCGRHLSLCCVSCVVASKQTPATNPATQTTSQAAESETQVRDFGHKECRPQTSAKSAPREKITRKKRRGKTEEIFASLWRKRFKIDDKTAVIKLTRCDSELQMEQAREVMRYETAQPAQPSKVTRRPSKRSRSCSQSISKDSTAKRLRSTTASAHSNQNDQSRSSYSKTTQPNSSASVRLNSSAQKRVSSLRRQDKRPARTVRGNKSEDRERSEGDDGVTSLLRETESDAMSPSNFDGDSDNTELVQFEDETLDSVSSGSETPKTETAFQDSSTTSRDSMTLAQKSVTFSKEPTTLVQDPSSMTQCSASLDPGMGAEADSSSLSLSSDLTSAPGSTQTSTATGPGTSPKSAGLVSDQVEIVKDKYPICDGIHFKDGRIKPKTSFSKFKCSKCRKTFYLKKKILRHMKNPRCDVDDSDEEWAPSDTDRKMGKNPDGDNEGGDSEKAKGRKQKRYRSLKEHTMEEFMTGKLQIPTAMVNGTKIQRYTHYTCSNCCKVVTTIREYRDHKCDPKFELSPAQGPDPESLEVLQKIAERRVFCCPHCNKIFFNGEQHKKHVRSHDYCIYSDDAFTCLFCNESFSKLEHLYKRHVNIIKEPKRTCKKCGFRFTSLCQIPGHMTEHQKKKESEPCKICGISFKGWKKKDKTKHLKTHKELREMVLCPYCGKNYPKLNFQTHLLSHSDEKPFTCPQCGKGFKNNGQLKAHQVYHDKKQFQCEECAASYYKIGELKFHVDFAHRKKGCACPECGKKLSDPMALKAHKKRVHGPQNNRRFSCEYCGFKFHNKTDLRTHVLIHTGEKPFVCETCGAKFKRKSYLTIHTRIHTNEKPYRCDDCGQGFAMRSSYTAHRKSRHPDKWVSCDHCGKVFPDEADLATHTHRFHDTGATHNAGTDTVHDTDATRVADTLHDTDATHVAHTDTLHDTDATRVADTLHDTDATRVADTLHDTDATRVGHTEGFHDTGASHVAHTDMC